MKSPMLPKDHQAAVRRVLDLGRSGDPAVLPGLIGMLSMPSNEVQRLAASAIGKLADFGADAEAAVAALAPLALKGRQAKNLDGVFEVDQTGMPDGPVLLLDDMVDSRWTFTVTAALLRQAGCPAVLPLALALNSPRTD